MQITIPDEAIREIEKSVFERVLVAVNNNKVLPDPNRVLTIADAQRTFGLSRHEIKNAIANGQIKAKYAGNTIQMRYSQVLAYIKNQEGA